MKSDTVQSSVSLRNPKMIYPDGVQMMKEEDKGVTPGGFLKEASS